MSYHTNLLNYMQPANMSHHYYMKVERENVPVVQNRITGRPEIVGGKTYTQWLQNEGPQVFQPWQPSSSYYKKSQSSMFEQGPPKPVGSRNSKIFGHSTLQRQSSFHSAPSHYTMRPSFTQEQSNRSAFSTQFSQSQQMSPYLSSSRKSFPRHSNTLLNSPASFEYSQQRVKHYQNENASDEYPASNIYGFSQSQGLMPYHQRNSYAPRNYQSFEMD